MSAARRIFAVALTALALCAATTGFAQDAEQRRGFSIAITQPANQEIVFGKAKIAAEVKIANPGDVDRVEFLVGDDTIFIDREPPYETFWDFGDDPKSWIVRAIAYHVDEIAVSDAIITRKISFSAFERVNRVVLWVSVTDPKGNLVTELARENFSVLEDGKPQKIIDFYPEDRPINMAILLDSSGSMVDKIEEVHAAAESFVDTLRPEDRALVIDFDENVFLIQDLTSDREALKTSISSTRPLGATALYDALHASYRKIGKLEGRKAIVLLTDGEDTSSQFGFDRVLEEAKGNNTLIYAIGLGGGAGGGPRRNVLKEFAENTGGRAFFVKKASELAGVYQRIADELRTQYYLTYSTDNDVWDGRWIKLRVDSSRKDHDVNHRRGYFAVRPDKRAQASGAP